MRNLLAGKGVLLRQTNIVGFLTGLGSAENIRVVQIPQSTVYVLSLESPISLFTRRYNWAGG
ncbi:hypothetical protein VB620_00515 [Nodularia harveyana UHCC-0300]|uniref:Uncharacterized protein n=1 Tax=Nodularia harveyana UHCC-0300 TaxID=2974287 RepID=A0ABU5U8G0_9CYAN|nr:hypothetical protein [Nodularia harveyana]MEA5579820.1 hypothetical protein [Nodularia harveyana UHCC-0300]